MSRVIDPPATGTCHCGAVTIEIDALPEWLTACNCSSRVSINARMLPHELISGLRTRRFDGASSWEFLDD